MISSRVCMCIREGVYGNPLFVLSGGLMSLSFDYSLECVNACVYVCVVVYECMECKEERRNSETHHVHTHSYTLTEVS